ncbi:hypothetical protein ABTN55_19660, partial [Acinetobacter baumannii]
FYYLDKIKKNKIKNALTAIHFSKFWPAAKKIFSTLGLIFLVCIIWPVVFSESLSVIKNRFYSDLSEGRISSDVENDPNRVKFIATPETMMN